LAWSGWNIELSIDFSSKQHKIDIQSSSKIWGFLTIALVIARRTASASFSKPFPFGGK